MKRLLSWIYQWHIERLHNADFEVCGHILCSLIRPYDKYVCQWETWDKAAQGKL